MRKRWISTLFLSVLLVSGCTSPSAPVATTNVREGVQPKQSFEQILKENSGKMNVGQVITDLPSSYVTSPDLYHYAFVNANGKAAYVYAEDSQNTNIISLDADLHVQKKTRLNGYQLKRAIRQEKILYIGYKNDWVVKYNTDSFDYNEVSKDELDRTRTEQEKSKLPDGETPILMRDGYVYTKEGVLFDQKSQEYVMRDGGKLKLYDHADFGVGSFLFSIDTRADGSLKVGLMRVSGNKISSVENYVFPLKLSDGYDMSHIEYDMTDKGNLLVFAIGVREQGKNVPVIKAFKIPFGDWMGKSKDVKSDGTV